VAKLWAEGKIDVIRNYADSDVLSLVGIYIRHLYVTGQSTAEDHDASMRSMVEFLEREKGRESMARFLETWRSADRPRPMFLLPQGERKPEESLQGAAA
jgi:hypothetical protein